MNLLQTVYLVYQSNGRASIPQLVVAAKALDLVVGVLKELHLSILSWWILWTTYTEHMSFQYRTTLLLSLFDFHFLTSCLYIWPMSIYNFNYIQCSVIFSKIQWSSAIFSVYQCGMCESPILRRLKCFFFVIAVTTITSPLTPEVSKLQQLEALNAPSSCVIGTANWWFGDFAQT